MARRPTWCLLAVFSLLTLQALSQDLSLSDALDDTSAKPTPAPKAAPAGGGKGGAAAGDFDLSDALNPENDKRNDRNKKGGDQISDSGDYTPDKGKGGRGSAVDSADDTSYDTTAETGTIAGIASAVVMALMGAIGSYVSYQKKKFCFSVQQSLNAAYAKAEGPESVVSQEPPVQQMLLQPPSAEPPSRL